MTLTHSSRLSASKLPHDNTAKREQNPHYSHYNGLKANTATLASSIPAGAPNCGQAVIKPRWELVRAHSIDSNTEPPQSPLGARQVTKKLGYYIVVGFRLGRFERRQVPHLQASLEPCGLCTHCCSSLFEILTSDTHL
jgi:hypothetical protein